MSSASSDQGDRVSPPFGPPDCPWREVKEGASIPESAVSSDGTLNGEPAFIGRVYYNNALYIGTAIPSKGVCIFLSGNSVQTSSTYEILTVDCGNPLVFKKEDLDSRLIFRAGKDEEGNTTYVGRHVDGDQTYVGWIQHSSKSLFIPRSTDLGSFEVKDGDYEVLIHQFLDRLCICPPCPPNRGSNQ